MSSNAPSQDLNLSLSPTTAAVSATIFLKTPKIEPKLEPFDTSYDSLQQPLRDTSFSDSTLNFLSYSQTTPLPNSSNDEGNLYSEYHRITELFRAAFAQRIQGQSGGVSVVDHQDSRAIVPFTGENSKENQKGDAICSDSAVPDANAMVPARRKYPPRSSELVRVTDLGEDDKRYFRGVVRRTRMVYDALRISSVMEEEARRRQMEEEGRGDVKGVEEGDGVVARRYFHRPRGDLIAATMMRTHGLWLNRDKRIVGSIPGIEVGDIFFFRMELCVVGLHGHTQAGIDYLPGSRSSNGQPIATSIIVSGGYEDDEDAGDVLIYTGHGGQDKFSKQCMHQKLEGGNLALERSMHYGIEVRVIRGFKYAGSVNSKVYVYDGLYRITDCWFDVGKAGFGVYKYKLVRIEGQVEMGSSILRFAQSLRTTPLSVRPNGYLSFDISNKKENVPVMLFNDIDNFHDPLYFDYLVRTVFPPFVFSNASNGNGCDCVSGCSEGCFCARKNGGEFAYDQNGFLLRGKPLIFECGPFCKCPSGCRNRVSQRGLRHRLEIFRSKITGWAVRSLDLIQAGSFICEYTGVILTREQVQVFTMNGDTLIYPNRFAKTWSEWGDLSQIYPDYECPSYPSVPPLDFAMDVSRMRNAACYMSHSSTPNILVQLVLYDHNNLMFPHLMLFALENIPPLKELCLDYGVAIADEEYTGKLAICI